MKKIIIATVAMAILIISCVASFYAGYYHVIHNQHAEECSDYPNRYHIIVDGNVYEYEFDDTNNYKQEVFTSWN